MSGEEVHRLLGWGFGAAVGGGWLSRVSPLPKVSLVVWFLVLTVSFGRYAWAGCVVFAALPLALAASGRLGVWRLFRRACLSLPLVLCAGLANVWYDREPVELACGVSVPGGVISLVVLCAKALATTGMVLVLSGTTTLSGISGALVRLRVPCLLVLQIQLLCRYLLLTAEEAQNLANAYRLRSPGRRSIPVGDWGMLCGRLFLRSVERANAVYRSMQCRLFRADRPLAASARGTVGEWLMCVVLALVLCVLRCL